jgi:hypothetical protein
VRGHLQYLHGTITVPTRDLDTTTSCQAEHTILEYDRSVRVYKENKFLCVDICSTCTGPSSSPPSTGSSTSILTAAGSILTPAAYRSV